MSTPGARLERPIGTSWKPESNRAGLFRVVGPPLPKVPVEPQCEVQALLDLAAVARLVEFQLRQDRLGVVERFLADAGLERAFPRHRAGRM